MLKKIWFWLVLNIVGGVLLGWVVTEVWQEPLIFWSILDNQFSFLIFLTLILLLVLGSLAPISLVLPPKRTLLGQGGLVGAGSLGFGLFNGMPFKVGLPLALALGLIGWRFSDQVAQKTKRFTGLYLGEIIGPAVRSSLGAMILLMPLTGFAASRLQPEEVSLTIPAIVIRQVLKPSIKVLNRQLNDQLQERYGNRFQEAIGTQDRRQIAEFIKAELIEFTEEGEVRQTFGLSAANLNLEKIKISPEGEIDLWPAVEASLPKITSELSETMFGYRWLVDLMLIFSQTLILGSWLWLASPLLTLLLGWQVNVLTALGYLKKKELAVTVTRLTLPGVDQQGNIG